MKISPWGHKRRWKRRWTLVRWVRRPKVGRVVLRLTRWSLRLTFWAARMALRRTVRRVVHRLCGDSTREGVAWMPGADTP